MDRAPERVEWWVWPLHVVDLTSPSANGPRPSFSKLVLLAILVWAIVTKNLSDWLSATIIAGAFGRSMFRSRMFGS